MAYSGQPHTFTPTGFAAVRRVPGVYWIVQAQRIQAGPYPVIYVGQSDDMERRLTQHYNDKKDCVWGHAPAYFFAETITTQPGRDAREKAEIRAYKLIGQAQCNEVVA